MVVCSVNCVNLHCRRIGLRVFFVFMKLEKRSNHRDSQVSKQLFMLEKEEREKKREKAASSAYISLKMDTKGLKLKQGLAISQAHRKKYQRQEWMKAFYSVLQATFHWGLELVVGSIAGRARCRLTSLLLALPFVASLEETAAPKRSNSQPAGGVLACHSPGNPYSSGSTCPVKTW